MEELTQDENHDEPDVEHTNKRQRVQQLEKMVNRFIAMVSETEELKGMALCNRETNEEDIERLRRGLDREIDQA